MVKLGTRNHALSWRFPFHRDITDESVDNHAYTFFPLWPSDSYD